VKCRNIALLALISWYLLAPALNDAETGVHIRAAIGNWELLESFDTARECEEQRDAGIQKSRNVVQRLRMLYAHCFATDDGRLSWPSETKPARRHCTAVH
jgi:hypothetical protein